MNPYYYWPLNTFQVTSIYNMNRDEDEKIYYNTETNEYMTGKEIKDILNVKDLSKQFSIDDVLFIPDSNLITTKERYRPYYNKVSKLLQIFKNKKNIDKDELKEILKPIPEPEYLKQDMDDMMLTRVDNISKINKLLNYNVKGFFEKKSIPKEILKNILEYKICDYYDYADDEMFKYFMEYFEKNNLNLIKRKTKTEKTVKTINGFYINKLFGINKKKECYFISGYAVTNINGCNFRTKDISFIYIDGILNMIIYPKRISVHIIGIFEKKNNMIKISNAQIKDTDIILEDINLKILYKKTISKYYKIKDYSFLGENNIKIIEDNINIINKLD